MVGQLVLLGVGFLLTSVAGGLLGSYFQRRTWAHQHEVERSEQDRQQAVKVFEEISSLLDQRLYRMRLVFWAARDRARDTGRDQDLERAREGYSASLRAWNDNLNRCLALVTVFFGEAVRQQLEEAYEAYAAAGRALDWFVRDVAAQRETEIPPLGRRLDRIGHLVYLLNVEMLLQLQRQQLGRSAPRTAPAPDGPPLVQLGDQGPAVDRLQRALRQAGHLHEPVDGIFGRQTSRALRDFQQERDLDPDAIAGPQTWASLAAPHIGSPGS